MYYIIILSSVLGVSARRRNENELFAQSKKNGDNMMADTKNLISDLCFGECLRWREGRLWFSDIHDHKVCSVDEEGNLDVIVEVPTQPNGLGWLPDGRLLIVSKTDMKLLTYSEGNLHEYADLSNHSSFHCNELVTDPQGNAYVGNFGFDLYAGEAMKPAELVLVTLDGKVKTVADDLMFPNGAVITQDNRTLIVAETFASRLTAFDINSDGTLSNRRVWAELENEYPDGISMDDAGGIWVASPAHGSVLRVTEGGEITDSISVERQAFACMLGGKDGRRLFIATASSSQGDECRKLRDGSIEYVDVQHKRAGFP